MKKIITVITLSVYSLVSYGQTQVLKNTDFKDYSINTDTLKNKEIILGEYVITGQLSKFEMDCAVYLNGNNHRRYANLHDFKASLRFKDTSWKQLTLLASLWSTFPPGTNDNLFANFKTPWLKIQDTVWISITCQIDSAIKYDCSEISTTLFVRGFRDKDSSFVFPKIRSAVGQRITLVNSTFVLRVQSVFENDTVFIYPNPAGSVSLVLAKTPWEGILIDRQGRIVRQIKGSKRTEIPRGSLPDGVYFLQTNRFKKTLTFK